MRGTYEGSRVEQIQIQRTLVQGSARLCSSIFGRFCKVLWPTKTAEQLAAAIGCSVRAAAYEISGEREPSARSISYMVSRMVERPAA